MYAIYADGKLLHSAVTRSDVTFSPKLTVEIGKTGFFSCSISPTHSLYNSFQKLKTSIIIESDESELFRGRVVSDSKRFDNTKTLYCEGNLAYLIDSVQRAEAFSGTTHELFRKIIEAHNKRVEPEKRFIVGDITIEDRSVIISGQSDQIVDEETGDFDYKQIYLNASVNEWENTYDYITRCLINYCGGYLKTRAEDDGVYIDYLSDYGATSTQEIEFGVNLLDLVEETSVEDLFTVLIPIGDDNLTIADVNNGSDELIDEDAIEEYGRIVRTKVFTNVNQASTLLENGIRYMNSNVNIPTTITIKAVDLHLLNPDVQEIHIGDKVRVKSAPHMLSGELTCTKIEYDLEQPANTVYTFGNPKQTLTDRYRKDALKQDNTASSGSGASAKAAEKTSTSKADAWCTVLKEEAFASIGASNERIDEMKRTLITECGIDFDGNTGNVNLRSLKEVQDEQGNLISRQGLQISLIQEENSAGIELVASRVSKVEEVEQSHYAELSLLVDDLGSKIELKADQIEIQSEIDGIEKTIASFNNKITNINSEITNINSEITNVKKLVATEIDSITVDTTWLETKNVKAKSLESDYIRGNASITMNNKLVATQEWVATKLSTDGYLTELPDYIRVPTLSATTNMYFQGWTVATQQWVKEYLSTLSIPWSNVTGKPNYFPAASHRHGFTINKSIANGHTHKVTVNGTTYTTMGVSTNATHTLSISGSTDLTGG